jgi:anti-sigma B factor antagonist
VTFLWRRTTKPASLDADVQAVCEQNDGECQVLLSGRITIDSSPDLRLLLLERLRAEGCQILTVAFCDVAYVDTSGLAMLVEILNAARHQGKTFYLSRLRERPRYLLETTRLLHLFDEVNLEEPQGSASRPEASQ